MQADIIWGRITKTLVFLYVTFGGGAEIYNGFTTGHVKSSFLFAFLSGLIFVGRIGYGYASGANKTIPADIYGLVVIWFVAFMRLYLDGF